MSEIPSAKQGDGLAAVGRDSFQVLSDTPTLSIERDYLNFRPYAQALAFLIDRKGTSTPLIMAISAPWGAGKTTLAQLIQDQLRTQGDWDEPHIICRFNAWKHDDAPYLGAAFAADVAQRVNRYRHWWRRLVQPLPSAMLTPEQRWRRRLCVILSSLAVAIAIVLGPKTRKIITATAQPSSEHWTAAEHAAHGFGLSVLVLLAALAFIYPKVFSGMQAVARFIGDPRSEAARGSMDSVRAQLGQLIRSATRGRRRLVIFVDDLERCRPPRAVEVCEVASQLLDHNDVVTLLVADMDAIAMSAALKYRAIEIPVPDQPDGEATRAAYAQYGRGYLQKLVQIRFDLPPATSDQLKSMLLADRRGAESDNHPELLPPAPPVIIYNLVFQVLEVFAVVATVILVFGTSWKAILLSAAAAVGVGILSQSVFRRLRRGRIRANRKRVDQEIEVQSPGTKLEEAVSNIAGPQQRKGSINIEQRYFHAVLDASGIVARADDLVFEFLPGRPRGAKRLLNQVRLMISIAIARGMFALREENETEEPEDQKADRVGKWLVLGERWPNVALAATRSPDYIEELEHAAGEATTEPLYAALDGYHISDIEDIEDLQRLLNRSPKFGSLSQLTLLSAPPTELKQE